MKKVAFFLPLWLTLLLIAWTAAVYWYSHYDSWQIYPALAILPVAIIIHAILIYMNKPRSFSILFAVLHMIALVPLWIGCLMLISKDSL
jgi:hypothetical protein